MNTQRCPLTEDEKRNMIAEVAFLYSKDKNQPADPEADWLKAERDVESALASECKSKPTFEEQSIPKRIRGEVMGVLKKVEGAVNQETIKRIQAKVIAEMRQKGSYVPETIDKTAGRFKSEFNGGVEAFKHQWHHLRIRQKQVLTDWKIKSNEALNEKAKALYKWTSNRHNNRS